MPSQYLEYHDDNILLEAYVAVPATEASLRPAVLVCHAWGGRGDFECEKADRLAALGYVGIAIDVYGKNVVGRDNQENAALMQPHLQDRAGLRRRLQAGLDAARSLSIVDDTRVAAIGFCFGGLCVLDMARAGADLRGVVSVHGLFNAADGLPNAAIKTRILALHGHDDPMVPPEKVLELEREMSLAGADWQIHVYGGTMHAFTNPQADAPENGMAYNAVAAARAWASMENFLAEVLA